MGPDNRKLPAEENLCATVAWPACHPAKLMDCSCRGYLLRVSGAYRKNTMKIRRSVLSRAALVAFC